MQQDYKSYDGMVKETLEKVKRVRREDERRYKEEEERRRILYDMLDKRFPGWEKHYMQLLGFTGPGPLTKEVRNKMEEMMEQMRQLPPDSDDLTD